MTRWTSIVFIGLFVCAGRPSHGTPEWPDKTQSRCESPFHLDVSPDFPGAREAQALRSEGRFAQAARTIEAKPTKGRAEGHRRFFLALLWLEAGDPSAALRALENIETLVPELGDYVLFLRGQALFERGDDRLAGETLIRIPADSPLSLRRLTLLARAQSRAGMPDNVLALLDSVVAARDPEDVPPALRLARARAYESTGDKENILEAIREYRLITLYSPTSTEAEQASIALKALARDGHEIPEESIEETMIRANAFLRSGMNDPVIEVLTPLSSKKLTRAQECDISYTLGVALQNERRYSDAEPYLERAAQRCEQDRIVKALYRLGRGFLRKGVPSRAESPLRRIVTEFPDHSYADDALFILGAAYLDRGRIEKGKALFEEEIRRFPLGDMRAEAAWRLAWMDYKKGRLKKAVERVEATLNARRSERETVAIHAGKVQAEDGSALLRERYWHTRWLEQLGASRERVAKSYASLIHDAPLHYYSVIAYTRLKALAPNPEKLIGLSAWPHSRQRDFGEPPLSVTERRAIELLRSNAFGFVSELLEPLLDSSSDERSLRVAWLLEQAGAYHLSHLGPREILRRQGYRLDSPTLYPTLCLGYPLAHRRAIARAAELEDLDPLLLLALAREESALDPAIRSWAGAIGLTQLMPATASDMARRLHFGEVKPEQLSDPMLNARLGAHYLSWLVNRYKGQVGLAIPAYNAGQGAVDRWKRERGSLPLDEFVEDIPYKQTRDYVKRVLSSYQAYQYLYRRSSPFLSISLYLSPKGTNR